MRIRSIKPEFWTSEAVTRLPIRARLTWIALWSYVDDNGVGRDNERIILASVFPLEDDPIETLANLREDLATLSRESRIVRYHVDGKAWLAVTNWADHQKIDKPNKPRYPGPELADAPLTCGSADPRETLATVSRDIRETPSPGAVEQGSSGTGEQRTTALVGTPPTKPKPTRRKRATAPPDQLEITDSMRDWGRENAPLVNDPVRETEKFLDHARANGKTFSDWPAAWRTWMGNAQTFAERRPGTSLALVGRSAARPSQRDAAVAQVGDAFAALRAKTGESA